MVLISVVDPKYINIIRILTHKKFKVKNECFKKKIIIINYNNFTF